MVFPDQKKIIEGGLLCIDTIYEMFLSSQLWKQKSQLQKYGNIFMLCTVIFTYEGLDEPIFLPKFVQFKPLDIVNTKIIIIIDMIIFELENPPQKSLL